MRLGLISDTHGNIQRTVMAEGLLAAENVSAVIHCGDIGSEAILISMAGVFEPKGVPIHAVLGNVDLFVPGLEDFPKVSGVNILGRFGDISITRKRIAIIHGDDDRKLNDARRSGDYDYILKGHSHQREDYRENNGARVINPGALHNTSTPSCAVLDIEKDTLKFIDII